MFGLQFLVLEKAELIRLGQELAVIEEEGSTRYLCTRQY